METQDDAIRAEARVERAELRHHPDAERAELVESYVDLGLTRSTAELVATEVHADPQLAVKVHLTQELGVDPDDQPSPWVAGASSFLCFALGALVPLLPFLLGAESLVLGLAAGAVGLFAAGTVAARFTTRPWWLGGLRQLGFGAIATTGTYLVGALIGVGVT